MATLVPRSNLQGGSLCRSNEVGMTLERLRKAFTPQARIIALQTTVGFPSRSSKGIHLIYRY